MNFNKSRALDFQAVDDLSFAAERGQLDLKNLNFHFFTDKLGPLLEIYQITRSASRLNSLKGGWLDASKFRDFGKAISSNCARWISSSDQSTGLLKANGVVNENDWVAFAIDAKNAAVKSGLSLDWSAQMVGALGEFHNNIIEHSNSQDSGIVAFHASPGSFEFIASDCGVGLLKTLREAPGHQSLDDHREALRLALTDGTSRFGINEGRGHGFRPLFIGMSNRYADLRFRTGNACLNIDGASPSVSKSRSAIKAEIRGFFVSVHCKTH